MQPQSPDVRLPPVAVVLGSYNQGGFVEATIRSIAAQTYRDFECVIVDDCSTDDSPARIEAVLAALGDPRFRAVLLRQNGGPMATMLTGLDATTAPFVAFIDADDIWMPAFLERHVAAHLSERGQAAVSASDLAVIDANGVQISGSKPNFHLADLDAPPYSAKVETVDGETRTFVHRSIPGPWIWSATSGLVFRRTAIDALRPLHPERIPMCADSYLVRSAHILGGTVRIERSLGYYRMHGANNYSRNPYFGDRVKLGDNWGKHEPAIREELAFTICARAEGIVASLSNPYLARAVIDLVGRERAFALAEGSAGGRAMMAEAPPEKPRRPGAPGPKRPGPKGAGAKAARPGAARPERAETRPPPATAKGAQRRRRSFLGRPARRLGLARRTPG